MYKKPALQKFGVFRELTRVGFSGSSDGASVIGPRRRNKHKKRRDHDWDDDNEVSSS